MQDFSGQDDSFEVEEDLWEEIGAEASYLETNLKVSRDTAFLAVLLKDINATLCAIEQKLPEKESL